LFTLSLGRNVSADTQSAKAVKQGLLPPLLFLVPPPKEVRIVEVKSGLGCEVSGLGNSASLQLDNKNVNNAVISYKLNKFLW